ncbi:MAG: hypothetical protein M3R15_05160, partial [Acidobacteriota bacterium]|nr:hypothetical protein [Acidobacteriota bacterium]
MNYGTDQLQNLLHVVRRRRQMLLTLRGVAICLVVAAVVLLTAGWLADRYRHSEGMLLPLRLSALLILGVALALFLIKPLMKRISDTQLARLIEERFPNLHDRLVTAVEFSGEGQHRASGAIVNRLRLDADRAAADVNLDAVIARRRVAAYGGAALGCLLMFVGVLKWGPDTLFRGVAQLVAPPGLASSAVNALSIIAKPGTARVP